MTIDEKIAVMTAYKEGARVQFKEKNSVFEHTWIELHSSNPNFNFQDFEYRIKQEEKPFEWDFENSDVLLGKIVKYRNAQSIVSHIGKGYFSTHTYDFYFHGMIGNLEIKIDNKWILFKDYKPE